MPGSSLTTTPLHRTCAANTNLPIFKQTTKLETKKIFESSTKNSTLPTRKEGKDAATPPASVSGCCRCCRRRRRCAWQGPHS